MKCGLLWYDGDPQRKLEEKVGLAAARYRQKFGRAPDVCYVHPEAVPNQGRDEPGISFRLEGPRATVRLIPAAYMLKHHFLLSENGGGRA